MESSCKMGMFYDFSCDAFYFNWFDLNFSDENSECANDRQDSFRSDTPNDVLNGLSDEM